MTDDNVPLDGNAAAGRLMDVFAFDMTSATVMCEGCGRESALATLALYGGTVGLVLRCPSCDAANRPRCRGPLSRSSSCTATNASLTGSAIDASRPPWNVISSL
jgi:uncharacterized protein DUF6510